MNYNHRFKFLHPNGAENNESRIKIIKDSETGVCYMLFDDAGRFALTVMYDSNGQVLIEQPKAFNMIYASEMNGMFTKLNAKTEEDKLEYERRFGKEVTLDNVKEFIDFLKGYL
jgi:hypothetical protein